MRPPHQTREFIQNDKLTLKEQIASRNIELMNLPDGVPTEAGTHKMTDATGRRQTVFTMVLECAAKCLPISSMIAEEGKRAYLRRIATQSRRIKREMRERKFKELNQVAFKGRGNYHKKDAVPLPDWLLVCNCASCGKVIRPVQQPHWGGIDTVHDGELSYKGSVFKRVRKVPFVCGYRDERPMCSACFRRNGW